MDTVIENRLLEISQRVSGVTVPTLGQKAEKLQRRGKDAYRGKKFKSAMKLFSQALEIPGISVALRVRILDNRAAAHEKLGGDGALCAALADAKQMIKLQKTYVNGYLRAGKILQLQRTDALALNLYEYGLKRLAPNDAFGMELLQKMYQKVQVRMKATKVVNGVDMMFVLPNEIVDMIIQKLSFQTLVLAQSVSRAWRQFLITNRHTYKIVDFSAAKRPISEYALETCVRRSRGRITGLAIGQFNAIHTRTLPYIAERCKDLSYLKVVGVGFESSFVVDIGVVATNLKTLILGCLMGAPDVAALLCQCENLESLECSNVEIAVGSAWGRCKPVGLQKLLLGAGRHRLFQDLCLQILLEFLPKLRELEVTRWTGRDARLDFSAQQDLSVLIIGGCFLAEFPLLPPSIRELDISGSPNLVCTSEHIAASPLPHLESFNCGMCPKFNTGMVIALLGPSLGRLRVLGMSMCPRIDFDSLDWLLDPGHGGVLEELDVAGNAFGDQVSKELGRLKLLKRLDASRTKVSGIGVLNLLNRSENAINCLCLDGCDNVGFDAIEKFRGMGVSVSRKVGDSYKWAQKIRYD